MKISWTILVILISSLGLFPQSINYNKEFKVDDIFAFVVGYDRLEIESIANNQIVISFGIQSITVGPAGRIYAKYLDLNGNIIGDEIIIDDESLTHPQGNSIAVHFDNSFIAVWSSFHNEDITISAKQFDLNGNQVGTRIRIDDNQLDDIHSPYIVTLENSDYIASWIGRYPEIDKNVILGQYFSNNHKVDTVFNICNMNTNSYINYKLATITNNRHILYWVESDQEYRYVLSFQFFDNSGTAINEKITFNKSSNNRANNYNLTVTDKNILVCCTDSDPDKTGIWAQIYDQMGKVVTDIFKVNTFTTNDQFDPCIATTENNSFLIVWVSKNQDGDQEGIFAQLYDSTGCKIGSEFQVNSTSINKQYKPRITAIPDEGFAITWINHNPFKNHDEIFLKYYLSKPINHELVNFKIEIPDNITVETINPEFTWQQPSDVRICYPWEIEYDLYLDTSNEFDNPLIYPGIQDTTFFLENDSLQTGTTYFWKVLAKNIEGDSLWSSNTNAFFVSHTATEVDENVAQLPAGFVLEQNYPNPFNPETTVRYSLPQSGVVNLKLYDITGREVMTLASGWQSAGAHTVKVDGRNLASGVYVYTLTAGDYRECKKMALVR